MNVARAYRCLAALGRPVVRTSDVAALFGESAFAASKTLSRLSAAELVRPIRHGLFWVAAGPIDPYVLPEYLTDPYPSYVSLQTALYLHGMIEQIPDVLYVVSLARTARVRTTVGTFSLHRVAPRFFGGFETRASGAKVATPEKALVDVAYLSSGKTRLFRALPELELPRRFRHRVARDWIARLASEKTRVRVTRAYEALCSKATPARRRGGDA